VAALDDGLTDVLFIVGSGSAPALQSRQFVTPIPVNNKLVFLPVAYPVFTQTAMTAAPTEVEVDGQTLALAPLTSIDLMARRSLQDDMPAIMLRAVVRGATSATLQYQAQQFGSDRRTAGVGLAAMLLAMGSVALSSADDRTWRALPAEISIARTRLPRGEHKITLRTSEGDQTVPVSVSGRYAVIDFRLMRRQVFVCAPKVGGAR
jgi:hypothetical protein